MTGSCVDIRVKKAQGSRSDQAILRDQKCVYRFILVELKIPF